MVSTATAIDINHHYNYSLYFIGITPLPSQQALSVTTSIKMKSHLPEIDQPR
jgi:hypothetical protein